IGGVFHNHYVRVMLQGHCVNRPHATASDDSSTEQRLHEIRRLERLKIFDLLTDADIFHRDAELFLDADDDTAFSRAVELGQNDAGNIGRFFEDASLLQAVLPCYRVQHQQRFVWRVRLLAGDYPANFFQLFDQMQFSVQPAGGIDQYNLYAAAFRGLHAVENHGGRIRAWAMLDDIDSDPLSPDIELFNRRSAEGVRRHQQ